jgi:nucleoid-associated protein YgaU
MRREWLMVLLVLVLLITVGCGPTARAVTTDDNLSDSATQNVQINEPASNNQPPKAVISGPTSGLVGETLKFSGAGSTDPDGRIASYAWDFGDGTTGSGVDVTHSYKAAGTYKVTLTVTDDGRGTAQATIQTQTSPASETYTVQSGDTLMEISRKLFDGDPQYWDEIADLNDIKAPNYTIYPGQQLKVPKK